MDPIDPKRSLPLIAKRCARDEFVLIGLRKLEKFNKARKKLGIDGKCPGGHSKANFCQLCQKIPKNLL